MGSNKKYGWDNIRHEILYENITAEEANQLEKKLIKEYNSLDPQKGYNKTAGGFSDYSAYDEDKIIELWKCGKNTTELRVIFGCCRHTLHRILKRNGITKDEMMARALGVAVKQYDLQGNYLKTFSSLSEAGRSISVNNSTHILECCNKERYSYHGYIWRYENDNEEVKPLEFSIHTRQVNQYSLSGEFIKTFVSIKDAALFAHINPNNISRVRRGERRSAGGYKWQYLDPPKKNFKGTRAIEQYNLDNELIANFPSIQEATRKTGICKSSIQSACCGKQKTAGGFIWKYIE